MKRILLGVGLFLAGCYPSQILHLGEGQEVVHTLPLSKQKQRIAFLQKKLEIAERDLHKAQETVENYHNELHKSQLAFIAKQVESYEQQMRKIQAEPRHKNQGQEEAALFLKERELLQHMLENGPSPTAFEAQAVLDRILRTITEFRDVHEGY